MALVGRLQCQDRKRTLCGKEEQLKPNYTLSEQGQDAGVSVFTGRAAAHRSTIGATKGYSVQRDFVFEPKVFAELENAQAIVLAYDGMQPAAAELLLPEAQLLGSERVLLRASSREGAMSWDVIIPFLRPIETLLRDPEVTDILVNGHKVFVERAGGSAGGAGTVHS